MTPLAERLKLTTFCNNTLITSLMLYQPSHCAAHTETFTSTIIDPYNISPATLNPGNEPIPGFIQASFNKNQGLFKDF